MNLRDLVPSHPVPDSWYDGKRIAVDGHNVAFRYLTSFRGRDGDVLRAPDGRVIAHLLGYTNLVRSLRSKGAEPIVVWDGDVHPRKRDTVRQRIEARLEAGRQAEAALAAGDLEAHEKWLRATTYLDPSMIRDCTALLGSLGVTVVRADHDGERYAAGLCAAGHADAVATEDYDALVAGAPWVLRKAGSAQPFLHRLGDLQDAGLDAAALRHVAIVCGTDWHPGVKGFGAKTAAKVAKAPGGLRRAVEEAHAGGADRHHRLIREADPSLTLEAFDELDRFIAQVPQPGSPARPRPDPGRAVELGTSMGLEPGRVLACFC